MRAGADGTRVGVGARWAWLALGAVALAGAAAAARFERRAVALDLAAPRDLHGGAYAGSVACRRCHEDHYRSWHRTFHRSMTAEATPASVRGDFSGATLRHAGVVARMDRDAAGAFRVTFAPEAGGAARAFTVSRTVGSRRYQQYLANVGDSAWRLPVAYDLQDQRWFPMTSAFLFPSEPWEGSEPPAGSGERSSPAPLVSARSRPVFGGGVFDRHVTRWNDNCVFCHNVAPDPGRDPATGAFRTSVAELGVACEACHGPGAEHAARNADPVRRYTLHGSGAADPTIVNPARLPPGRAADVCGRCHGQRLADDVGPFLAHGDPFVPGDDLGLYTAPLWRDTPLAGARDAFAARFWGDGTPRLTAYEYQGLLQSACAQRGALTCTSCHGMHDGDPRGQLRPAFAAAGEGGGGDPAAGAGATTAADRMCTGCHAALAAPEAQARHSHHDARGAGARCAGCHMPRVVYGVLDVHRSHRIEIPDRARAARDGRPDACATCHVDGPGAWAPRAAFAGDALTRAVAVDALGRAPVTPPLAAPAGGGPAGAGGGSAAAGARAVRLGVLLDVMARDRYPAVRHLAWRAARRLGAPGAGLASGYDPAAPPAARATVVDELRRVLGAAARAPDPSELASLRAAADRGADLEIGE